MNVTIFTGYKYFLESYFEIYAGYGRNQQFSGAEERILSIVKSSKTVSTNKKYDVYFQKFRGWCIQNNIGYLPASVEAVAVYINGFVQKSVPESVLLSHFYSIKWYHDFNLLKNPSADKLINLMIEGSKRILGRSIVNKKLRFT